MSALEPKDATTVGPVKHAPKRVWPPHVLDSMTNTAYYTLTTDDFSI